jgi:hypothetical protein
MLKRANEIKIRLTDDEISALTKRAKESCYSRESYVRSLINGRVPQPKPPPDYHTFMKQLHYIGNNMNQVAQKAHVFNSIDVQRYDEALRQFAAVVAKIEEAVILPRKLE